MCSGTWIEPMWAANGSDARPPSHQKDRLGAAIGPVQLVCTGSSGLLPTPHSRNGSTNITIQLTTDALELDPIIVTASRREEKLLDSPASVSTMTLSP